VQIDIISDVVCPWCYVGLRRLEQALQQAPPEQPVQRRWHGFELNPDIPETGISRHAYLTNKFGTTEPPHLSRLSAIGAEEGIAFNWAAMTHQPHTAALHALTAQAPDPTALMWALFDAYFSQGRNLTDLNELAQVLQPLGLDRSWVEQHRQLTPTVRAQRQEQQVQWQRMGVQGVPFFIFNQRVAVSGAQPAEVLTQAMAQASEPEKT
jgi:predicted DsbA family dithiol-disulfide isomerase